MAADFVARLKPQGGNTVITSKLGGGRCSGGLAGSISYWRGSETRYTVKEKGCFKSPQLHLSASSSVVIKE